jgi:hypothetical protein
MEIIWRTNLRQWTNSLKQSQQLGEGDERYGLWGNRVRNEGVMDMDWDINPNSQSVLYVGFRKGASSHINN